MESGYEEYVLRHFDPAKKNYEEIIAGLRKAGASPIETMRALIKTLALPIDDADKLVLYSETWKDQLEAHLRLRNSAEKLKKQIIEAKEKLKNF